jgi:single-strand DNA-binding protein
LATASFYVEVKRLKRAVYLVYFDVELVSNQDPEVVNLDSGKKLVKFSIATNAYDHNTSGEKITNTYWHTIFA